MYQLRSVAMTFMLLVGWVLGDEACGGDDGFAECNVNLLQSSFKMDADNLHWQQVATQPSADGGEQKGSGNRNGCLTIGDVGVGAGHKCVFPFTYETVIYSACIMVDSESTPWCYTQVDDNGGGVAGAWGSCAPSCAPELTSSIGIVDEMYSYGPPAAGFFQDLAHFGGCFPGMRVYTENVYPSRRVVADFASMATSYYHALSSTLVLHWNSGDSWYIACPGKSGWPHGAYPGTLDLHLSDAYMTRIKHNTDSALSSTQRATVITGLDFAKLVYDITVKPVNVGWALVASHVLVGYSGMLKDNDRVLLAQNQSSLECVLAFSGTDAALEALTSITSTAKDFCGFSSVHKGFADEIWSITASTEYQNDVKPKLGKCKRVTVVGHSLGGAISEVFAACVNSGRTEDPAYQQMSWNKGTAELMSSI